MSTRWDPTVLVPESTYTSEIDDYVADVDGKTLRSKVARELASMSDSELMWRKKQEFLKARGYILRPRYQLFWYPSWRKAGLFTVPPYTEDAIPLPTRTCDAIDATRSSDGEHVFIKRIPTDASEVMLLRALMGQESIDQHCATVLDLFNDRALERHETAAVFVVFKYLRPLSDPSFEYIGEILTVVEHLLQGLSYMHKQGVFHGNIVSDNIMMDPDAMYPDGFHPVRIELSPDLRSIAWHYPRIVPYVNAKYYFTGFGNAGRLPTNKNTTDMSCNATLAEPADKLDISDLGRVLLEECCDKYSNVGFLAPLILSMTQPDPKLRPSATQLLQTWRHNCTTISPMRRLYRLRPAGESRFRFFVLVVFDFVRVFVLAKLPLLERWPKIHGRVTRIVQNIF